jgi:hypothetical protein
MCDIIQPDQRWILTLRLCRLQFYRGKPVYLQTNVHDGGDVFHRLSGQRSMFQQLLCNVYDVLRLFAGSVVFLDLAFYFIYIG